MVSQQRPNQGKRPCRGHSVELGFRLLRILRTPGASSTTDPGRNTAAALATKKKSQAIALGNLTLALIRQGKLDEAATTMHRTIDAVELTRGGGGLNLAFTAGRELRQWRHESWAQEINDRLLALMTAI